MHPLQPPTPPTFSAPIPIVPVTQSTQLHVGSVVAASRRASVAAVERLVEKLGMGDEEKESNGKFDHRLSLTCTSDLASGLRPLTPDLASSPDDEQSMKCLTNDYTGSDFYFLGSLGTLEFNLLYDTENQTLTVSVIRAQVRFLQFFIDFT